MSERIPVRHVSAEQLQTLLDGALSASERAHVEAHLAQCALCAAELKGWQVLYRSLGELPALAPSVEFREKVLAGLSCPEPRSLAARARVFLGLPAAAGHPEGNRLQDFVEGLLPARHAARVQAHLDSCALCAAEAAAWRATYARLGSLERLSPGDGFADQVMAQVRAPQRSPARIPEWRRALAWAWLAVPRTRRAWAALSGVAVAPAVTLGLVLWTVFTHPTFTPGALASFVEWKVSALTAAAWEWLASYALQSAGLFELYSIVGSFPWSPAAMGGAFVALSAGTVGATWVLYRNLFAHHPANGRVNHAPLS